MVSNTLNTTWQFYLTNCYSVFVERNAQFNRWKKLTWKYVFYFIFSSILWQVEENLGWIYLNNLLSPRTQDCVDVSHLKISWELMKSGAWYWCDNYAREDMTNSQCKMTRWKLVECQKEKTEARLIDHRVCLRCLPKPQWLASCVWKYFFSGFVSLFSHWEVNIRLDEVLLGCWGLTWLDCGRCPVVGGEISPLGRLRLRAEGEM